MSLVHVHPLVILSIADHHTRIKMNNPQGKVKPVFGVLYGMQQGLDVMILETVEIAYKEEKDQEIQIEHHALETDMRLFSACYPSYEMLGWYSTGKSVADQHKQIHDAMKKYNERPLFLLLDPDTSQAHKNVPMAVYEEQVHKNVSEFVRTNFQITADEAERVTMVHCAKVVSDEKTGSALTPTHMSLIKALNSLRERVSCIHTYLAEVKEGKRVADQRILREIKSLCQRLPTMDSATFQQHMLKEYNDAMLVTYLSSVTQSSVALKEALEKYQIANAPISKRGSRSAMMMGDDRDEQLSAMSRFGTNRFGMSFF